MPSASYSSVSPSRGETFFHQTAGSELWKFFLASRCSRLPQLGKSRLTQGPRDELDGRRTTKGTNERTNSRGYRDRRSWSRAEISGPIKRGSRIGNKCRWGYHRANNASSSPSRAVLERSLYRWFPECIHAAINTWSVRFYFGPSRTEASPVRWPPRFYFHASSPFFIEPAARFDWPTASEINRTLRFSA